MKLAFYFFIGCCLAGGFISAQSPVGGLYPQELVPGKYGEDYSLRAKMPCDPTDSLTFVSCASDGSSRADDDPSDGYPVEWEVSGITNLAYTTLQGPGVNVTIVNAANPNIQVFPTDANSVYTGLVNVGTDLTDCFNAGTWTIQVWDVTDNDGNGYPDPRTSAGDPTPINGCFVECTFTLNPICPPLNTAPATVTVENVGCTNQGSIELTNFDPNDFYCVGSDGSGAQINWTGDNGYTGTGTSISGLAPGTYTADIRDGYNCPASVSAVITTLPPVMASCGSPVSPSVFGAADGSVTIDITDGTGDYTISWTGPANGSRPGFDGPNLVDGLLAGNYTFTITDDVSGCSAMCSITIDDPPCVINFTVSESSTGDIIITMTDGTPNFMVNYIGPVSQANLGPFTGPIITLSVSQFVIGDYQFEVFEENRNSCVESVSHTIAGTDCSDLTLTGQASTNPNCAGTDNGSIALTVVGDDNPTITWMGPGVNGATTFTITDLGSGTYRYEILDDKSCFLEGDFTLTTPPALVFSCGGVDESQPALDDGKIGLNMSGGTPNYTLSYTAVDPDGNGLPPVTNLPVADMDTLRNLPAGTYSLSLTDANGCMLNCSVTIIETACSLAPTCSPTDATTVGGTGSVEFLFDGTADWTATVTGPQDSNFTATGNTYSIANLPQGNYSIAVVNTAGCTGSCFFTIGGPTCGIIVGTDQESPTCAGATDGAIYLDISGQGAGLQIDWDNDLFDGQDTVRGLGAGTYVINVSDATGCILAPINITLTQPDSVRVNLTEPAPIACGGDSTGTLAATVTVGVGPFTYDWSVDSLPDVATVGGLVAGTYALTLTDNDGCIGVANTIINEPPVFSMTCGAVAESSVAAADGKLGFTLVGGTPPYSFSLNGANAPRPS
ncbi:MAG: hypothetical protein AAGF89_09700, partial [Bacteroidota bacterium]